MEIKEIRLPGIKRGYKITDTGKVYGLFGRELKYRIKRKRATILLRSTDNKQKDMQVSRLVAMAFCKRPKPLVNIPYKDLEVHHIDRDPSNNNKDNLLWVTREEHMSLHQTAGDNKHQSVVQLTGNKIVGLYTSFKTAAKATGIPIQNISDTATGKIRIVGKSTKKRKSAGGYNWTQKLEGYYEISLL